MYTTRSTEDTLTSLVVENYKLVSNKDWEVILEMTKSFEWVNGELLRTDEYPSKEVQKSYLHKEIIILKEEMISYSQILTELIDKNLVDLDSLKELKTSVERSKDRIREYEEYLDIIEFPQKYVEILKEKLKLG